MLKSLQDFGRRSIQIILVNAGQTSETVDEEFDVYHRKFLDMIADMNQCGAAMHSYQNDQQAMFNDAKHLSSVLDRIYETNIRAESSKEWPGVTNKLEYGASAEAYATKWEAINSTYRGSVAAVKTELALEPLHEAVAKGTEMNAQFKTRQVLLVDFNSYKRQVAALAKKMETSKDNTENQKEMHKLKTKLTISESDYTAANKLSKEAVIASRGQHDETIDMLLITTIVGQGQLFKQMSEQIQEVVNTLPKDKVDKVLNRINDYMEAGGPVAPVLKERTRVQKGIDYFRQKFRTVTSFGKKFRDRNGESNALAKMGDDQDENSSYAGD
jgi:hypothetical protein